VECHHYYSLPGIALFFHQLLACRVKQFYLNLGKHGGMHRGNSKMNDFSSIAKRKKSMILCLFLAETHSHTALSLLKNFETDC
jgi:hypothetical protein